MSAAAIEGVDRLVRAVRTPLLRWYRRHRRDLPWRRTRDPYAIWVSEVMLQQTQVATVLPYYERFLARFPDPASLAAADEEEVLGAWSGLGYYRRARALHAGARTVAERHGGAVPHDPAALLALPGVGRYTAGAVASIAFDLPEPILDGNVRRVLARLLAFDASGISRGAEDRALWDVATRLVAGPAPGDLNQGLMELGALVCTPRGPACSDCPLEPHCAAATAGSTERFPTPRDKPATTTVDVAAAWIVRNGRVLVERPAPAAPLRGRFDLPAAEVGTAGPDAALRELFATRHDLRFESHAALCDVRHGIMNRRLRVTVRGGKVRGRIARGDDTLRWLPLAELDTAPVSGATQKIARRVASAGSSGSSGPAVSPGRSTAAVKP